MSERKHNSMKSEQATITKDTADALRQEREQARGILEAVQSGRGLRIYAPDDSDRHMINSQGCYVVSTLLSEAQSAMIEGLIERYMMAAISDIDKIIGSAVIEQEDGNDR